MASLRAVGHGKIEGPLERAAAAAGEKPGDFVADIGRRQIAETADAGAARFVAVTDFRRLRALVLGLLQAPGAGSLA
jgi:hypothetical protein